MPYVLVEDFKSGIDTRRTSVTSVPGSLYGLNDDGVAGLTNAHITRGGEIEKRRAFKLWTTLPANTHGLAAGGGRVYVFADCHTGRPSMTGQPEELSVIKMESRYKGNAGEEDMAKVLSVDFFDGKPYAAVEFEDGRINHYWGDHDDPGGDQPKTTIVSVADSGGDLQITSTNHNLDEDDVIRFTTTDTLPTGLALATDYYVVGTPATNTFFVSTSESGSEVTYTNAGTGTHYWQSGIAMNRIIEQYDGRARASFSVTGGQPTATTGTAAAGTVVVNAGTVYTGNNLLFLRIDNVDILDGPIAHTGNNNTTATAIANAITAKTSVPNYTATASTATVTITAADKGTTANGKAITSGVEGDFGIANGTSPLAGGIDNALTDLTMDGISIIRDPVLWETSHSYTAQKIADEINSTATSPEWEAVANAAEVTIIAETQGAAVNNYYNSQTHVETKTGDLLTTTPSATTSGGATVGTGQQAGSYVMSNKYAIHSLEESTWRWCGVGDPTDWTSSINTSSGAGFQTLSNHARNSEELMAMSTYFENMAILAQDCIQIWFYDPDPNVIQLVQVLNNTGTIASKSVIAIGDADVFYLSRSGIRSLKSRDSSNAAYIGDIGNPLDDIIMAAVQDDPTDGRDACGILDPRSGRYLLALGSKVYVFSYFPSSRVSAWSVYETTDSNGDSFVIESWAFDGRQVLCRSGDKVYSLGGLNDNEYDDCTVTVQLPFLDAQTPATTKMWSGIDLVCSSTWSIKIAGDPTDIESNELAATINKVTYGLGRIGLSTTSTHLALKLENTQEGAAKLGTLAVHYSLNEAG